MKLSGMAFFQIASQRMQWLGERQVVISENIANADTPDYKAKDISPFDQMLEEGGQRTRGLR
ncbi:MAG: flagellar basal body rod protein FlgB, partial [Pseudooceanicola nanhaiensis]